MAVLLSTLLFAFATVLAKYATRDGGAHAVHVTMARFLVGLAITAPMVFRDRSLVVPRNLFWVLTRAVTNVVAVLLFFTGVQLTTVSKANLLNMTFPVFVFGISPFVTREKIPWYQVLLLVVTLIGVWNVVAPGTAGASGDAGTAVGDMFAFASAVAAGLAITSLRMARGTDSSGTIIFYVMAVGTVVNAVLLIGYGIPGGAALALTIGGGAFGAIGQFALTYGFRYVPAALGSLLATARIGFAFLFGIALFHDSFSVRGIIGTALILGSLVAVSILTARATE